MCNERNKVDSILWKAATRWRATINVMDVESGGFIRGAVGKQLCIPSSIITSSTNWIMSSIRRPPSSVVKSMSQCCLGATSTRCSGVARIRLGVILLFSSLLSVYWATWCPNALRPTKLMGLHRSNPRTVPAFEHPPVPVRKGWARFYFDEHSRYPLMLYFEYSGKIDRLPRKAWCSMLFSMTFSFLVQWDIVHLPAVQPSSPPKGKVFVQGGVPVSAPGIFVSWSRVND